MKSIIPILMFLLVVFFITGCSKPNKNIEEEKLNNENSNLNNEYQYTEEELKWNKMWDLWAEEKIESPYEELMRYQNEINNGGHFQYFLNVEGNDDLEKEISVLKTILPDSLKENFQNAYDAYTKLGEDKDANDILYQCDKVFYDNEIDVDNLLKEYSKNIEL